MNANDRTVSSVIAFTRSGAVKATVAGPRNASTAKRLTIGNPAIGQPVQSG
jgi:hypothetical protein